MYTPNSYLTLRIIFNTYSDSSCSTQTAWFAVTSNVQKEIPKGTFITQQSSPSSCSVTLRGTLVTSNGACIALSMPGGYGRISSCPTYFTPATTAPPATTINWAGNYQVNSGCSTSTCCCLTGTVQVVQSGLSIKIQGLVTGNCGTTTGVVAYGTLSSSTSTTVTFTLLGSAYSATRSGNQVIVTNLGTSQWKCYLCVWSVSDIFLICTVSGAAVCTLHFNFNPFNNGDVAASMR